MIAMLLFIACCVPEPKLYNSNNLPDIELSESNECECMKSSQTSGILDFILDFVPILKDDYSVTYYGFEDCMNLYKVCHKKIWGYNQCCPGRYSGNGEIGDTPTLLTTECKCEW